MARMTGPYSSFLLALASQVIGCGGREPGAGHDQRPPVFIDEGDPTKHHTAPPVISVKEAEAITSATHRPSEGLNVSGVARVVEGGGVERILIRFLDRREREISSVDGEMSKMAGRRKWEA